MGGKIVTILITFLNIVLMEFFVAIAVKSLETAMP
jgi:hypothetical protein